MPIVDEGVALIFAKLVDGSLNEAELTQERDVASAGPARGHEEASWILRDITADTGHGRLSRFAFRHFVDAVNEQHRVTRLEQVANPMLRRRAERAAEMGGQQVWPWQTAADVSQPDLEGN